MPGLFVGMVCAHAAENKRPNLLMIDKRQRYMEVEYLEAQQNLAIIERSDWINVKTDVEPAAIGDGLADDTAALQAALDTLTSDQNKYARPAVYFPPGNYRITRTLKVSDKNGGAIYGHGRATRIVWDGGEGTETEGPHNSRIVTGARMFHSNGFGRCLYYGLTFDGQGKATVGVDHDSKSKYETRVRYQYCAFRNFTDSGIRVGHDQKTASAEMMFYDCVFENCRRGISTLQFNDYDNAVVRCIFRDCGTGVFCHRGNFYVRDSHFENSKEQDIILPPHSHSIRRCTSQGSDAFVRGSQPGHWTVLLQIQDCLVEGWTSKDGAVQLGNSGPVLFFDSVFRNPGVNGSPAIALVNKADFVQTLLTANVRYGNGVVPLKNDLEQNRVIDIPRDRPESLIFTKAAKRWVHRPGLPEKILDVVTDFGADNSGRKDASAAIQKAIDAAAAHDGGFAEVYLQPGTYALETTVKVKAGNYQFGGAYAWGTQLRARPADTEKHFVMVHADNADGVTINHLRFEAPKEMDITGLRVTADGPGKVILDDIWSGGGWMPRFKGTHLDHLPAGFIVRSPHLDGEVTIDNCGDADVLIDYWFAGYDGPVTVKGPTGKGFVGFHSAVSSHADPDLTVLDNASVVFGDYYTEQTHQHLLAKGSPDLPPGRVTLSNAKLAARRPGIVQVDGYRGQITVSRSNMMYIPDKKEKQNEYERGKHQPVLPVKGTGETTLLLLGTSHFYAAPVFEKENAEIVQVGGVVWSPGGESGSKIVSDTPKDGDWAETINNALDHLHELTTKELRN